MSQISIKSGSVIKTIIPEAGDNVNPTGAGEITLTGVNDITITGNAATQTVDISLSGTTEHAVQVGDATGGIESLAVGTDGQVLIGATAGDPAFATLTSSGGTITFTTGANTLNLEAVAGLPVMTDGQLLIGSTGLPPVAASLTAGANITITPGAGSIEIASTGGGGGLTWSEATSDMIMVVDNGYITKHATPASELVYTLPAASAVGKVLRVAGYTSGGWKIAQGVGQQVIFSDQATTSGVGGYLEFTNRYDCVEMVCVVTDTTWLVTSSIGNITIA